MLARSRVCPRVVIGVVLVGGLEVSSGFGTEVRSAGEGAIDGRATVSFWPLDRHGQRIGPSGHRVVLVAASAPDDERELSAGSAQLLPAGEYTFWLEGPATQTPAPELLAWAGSSSVGRGAEVDARLSPAGEVSVEPALARRATRAWLLSVDGHLEPGSSGRVRHRTPDLVAAERGVLMPPGHAVAMLFDPERREIEAISTVVPVEAGGVTLVAPGRPAVGSDIVIVLDRATPLEPDQDPSLSLSLSLSVAVDDLVLVPDVVVAGRDRVYAIWYAVEGRVATVRAESVSERLVPRELTLHRGHIELLEAAMVHKPAVTARIRIDEALAEAPARLEILDRGGRRAYDEVVVVDGAVVTFRDLPAELLVLRLEVDRWQEAEYVDLRDGEDHELDIALEVIRIWGVVHFGGKPHPGSVVLFRGPERLEAAESDEEGRYELVIYGAGVYNALATLRDSPVPGMEFWKRESIVSDTRWDFELPDNSVLLQVLDTGTREPVGRGRVEISNRFGGSDANRVVELGRDGFAQLPPSRPGTLELTVRAPGYAEGTSVLEIGDSDGPRHEMIELRRLAPEVRLRLQLADGRPAAFAEALVISDPLGQGPRSEARADSRGELELPHGARTVLVRHPEAGATAFDVATLGLAGESLTLSARAPAPLEVRAVDATGSPVGARVLVIWLGGQPLAGITIPWLFGSLTTGTDGGGGWVGHGLPVAGARIAVLDAGSDGLARLEVGLDPGSAAAIELSFPWPVGGVEIAAP